MASTDSNEPKVKLMQVAQQNCELILGIGLNRKRLNANVLIISFIIWSAALSDVLFLYFEAKTFREYTESVFVTTTMITIGTCFTIIVVMKDVLFNLINFVESIANTSESTSFK